VAPVIGFRIGGEFLTSYQRRRAIADRRAKLRAAAHCINGPLEDRPGRKAGVVHGPVVGDSGKCQRCLDAWAKTAHRETRAA